MTKPTEEQIRHAYGQFIYMNGYTETPQNAKDLFLTPENVFRDGYERGYIAALSLDPWHYPPEMPTENGWYNRKFECSPMWAYRFVISTFFLKDGTWDRHPPSGWKELAWMPIPPVKETP